MPKTVNFIDTSGHEYEIAIEYLAANGIIHGYADGTYGPDDVINRAEFTKIVLGAFEDISFDGNLWCFIDVDGNEWYASYVCYAKQQGIISGYPDGQFRPANTINLVEASKILVNTFGLEAVSCECGAPWYEPYIRALQNQSYTPSTLTTFAQEVTRGEMAEMIWRIMEEIHSSAFSQFTF